MDKDIDDNDADPKFVSDLQPFELDYVETFFTLADVMVEVYQKLLVAPEACSTSYFELVLKCDGKLKVVTPTDCGTMFAKQGNSLL